MQVLAWFLHCESHARKRNTDVWKQYTYVRKEYSVMVKSIPTMERLNPTYVIISRIATSFLESCGKSENEQ